MPKPQQMLPARQRSYLLREKNAVGDLRAEANRNQTEADHAGLVQAVKSGRVKAITGE
jgi:hypothetical protein